MLNNNKKSRSDDISVIDVLLALWKDKKLLSLMSMFFTFLGFMYSLTLNKNIELSSTVVVKEHPRQFFANYEPFFDDNVIDFDEDSFLSILDEKILSYDNLDIKDGGTASNIFLSMVNGTFNGDIKETRKQLLEYCYMDTFAMVKILEKLIQI